MQDSNAYEPLTITVHLRCAPILSAGPVYFDAMLQYALGCAMGDERGDWVDPKEVQSQPLPLARVETPRGWWYAASCARAEGPQQHHYFHRRAATDMLVQLTDARTVEIGTGVDKSFRLRAFRRTAQRSMMWTCVGNAAQIAALLPRVVGVGAQTRHHGQIDRWEIARGGPALDEYSRLLALRHLPSGLVTDIPPTGRRINLPLRPPYYLPGVDCWQIV